MMLIEQGFLMVKVESAILLQEHRLISLFKASECRCIYHGVCVAWSVWYQTYDYLPSHRALRVLLSQYSLPIPL